MAITDPKFFNKKISESLSEYLKKYTSGNDRSRVNLLTGISYSTITYVMYRTNNLTKNNARAVEELMKIAIQNCNNNIKESRKAKSKIQTILDSMFKNKEDN